MSNCQLQGLLIFMNVAVEYSQDEWEYLDCAQRIYVMLETYSHLFCVGKDALLIECLIHPSYLPALYICKLSVLSKDPQK